MWYHIAFCMSLPTISPRKQYLTGLHDHPQENKMRLQDPTVPKATWADCWKCLHSIPKFMCPKLTEEDTAALGGCPPSPALPTTHVSLYAAQIAWWLSFFPPDRFLILKSSDLHDPDGAMEVRRHFPKQQKKIPQKCFGFFCSRSALGKGRYC